MSHTSRTLTPEHYQDTTWESAAPLKKASPVPRMLQLVLAYEWLVSGLDKVGNSHFDSQLVIVLQQSTQSSRYGWYASLLRQVVLPNHSLFAWLAQMTELAIGVALLVGGGLGLLRPHARLTIPVAMAASAALLGSAILSLNYFFQGNCPIPWINPAFSFGPGVNINILVALISLVLFAGNVRVLYRWRTQKSPHGRLDFA